ncbi:hypothetical protein V8C86DRAFT_3129088, partial [Haematococcus lacustris]
MLITSACNQPYIAQHCALYLRCAVSAEGAGTPNVIPIGLPPNPRHIAGDAAMKDAVLQLAGPAYTPQEQPDGYVRRLEAACQLLHEGLRQTQATGAQAAFPGPSFHKAAPGASHTPSAADQIAARKLCTLLLTDLEVLDVVLALHDVRAAQLCHLMPWSGSHPLKLPPPSKALAKQ